MDTFVDIIGANKFQMKSVDVEAGTEGAGNWG